MSFRFQSETPQSLQPVYNAAFIQGQNVSTTTPATGEVLEYDGSQWIPGAPSSGITVTTSDGPSFVFRDSVFTQDTAPVVARQMLFENLTGTYTSWVTLSVPSPGNIKIANGTGGVNGSLTATNYPPPQQIIGQTCAFWKDGNPHLLGDVF